MLVAFVIDALELARVPIVLFVVSLKVTSIVNQLHGVMVYVLELGVALKA
jgi:hypothetical protein